MTTLKEQCLPEMLLGTGEKCYGNSEMMKVAVGE